MPHVVGASAAEDRLVSVLRAVAALEDETTAARARCRRGREAASALAVEIR